MGGGRNLNRVRFKGCVSKRLNVPVLMEVFRFAYSEDRSVKCVCVYIISGAGLCYSLKYLYFKFSIVINM